MKAYSCKSNRDLILKCMSRISPMASEYVRDSFSKVIVIFSILDEGQEGFFLKVVENDLCIYYASFSDDSSPEILDKISREISAERLTQQEICFNIFGENRRVIAHVQNNGFSLDMAGFVLRLNAVASSTVYLGDLTTCGFNPRMLEAYIDLFEKAYEQLNIDNGWDTRSYFKHINDFGRQLCNFNDQRLIQSFWLKDVLVGCYIINGCYITDLVVQPRFQNRGYGRLILRHCISFMREHHGLSEILLRVTESNQAAKRFYERNGFDTISHFAEHTFRHSL